MGFNFQALLWECDAWETFSMMEHYLAVTSYHQGARWLFVLSLSNLSIHHPLAEHIECWTK
jgi:hypothetical protein